MTRFSAASAEYLGFRTPGSPIPLLLRLRRTCWMGRICRTSLQRSHLTHTTLRSARRTPCTGACSPLGSISGWGPGAVGSLHRVSRPDLPKLGSPDSNCLENSPESCKDVDLRDVQTSIGSIFGTARKYAFDVTSVGQRLPPWPCNSIA